MKAPKRVNSAIKFIEEQQTFIDYYLGPDSKELVARRQETKRVVNLIKYLAIEKKKHRIRLAKKLRPHGLVKGLYSFPQRVHLGLKFIFKRGEFR